MLVKKTLWLHILIFLCSAITLQSSNPFGDQQKYPPNKIPDDALNPQRSVVRRKILLYHNFFRSKVQPTASNMLLMQRSSRSLDFFESHLVQGCSRTEHIRIRADAGPKTSGNNVEALWLNNIESCLIKKTWHEGAARQAQKYAERCRFLEHNDPLENSVPHFGSCGQNLFVAAQKTPWFFALKTWFVEYQNFTYGFPVKNFKAVGHYTQMVWATSHKLGCGLAKCSGGPWGHFYNYVCHYCPGGNYDTITHYPYKKGTKCGDCPNSCVSDSLCTNVCPAKDVYSNCAELVKITDSICAQGSCNATCLCGEKKIHRNFPWV